jgi:hypothetical protein
MKRVYKIVVLFVIIFLVGVFCLVGYINYTLNKKETVRSTEISRQPAKQNSVRVIYLP